MTECVLKTSPLRASPHVPHFRKTAHVLAGFINPIANGRDIHGSLSLSEWLRAATWGHWGESFLYLVIDCETTGIPRDWRAPVTDVRNWPRVVQLAWMLLNESDQPIESASHLVQPDGFTIPVDAQRIHGITTSRAKAEGKPLANVLEELSVADQRSRVVVAHNMDFDYKIIAAEYLRLGLGLPFKGKSLLCTMKGSTNYCRIPGPYGYKWPTLPELHHVLFGDDCAEAHDAAVDVAICAKCFLELKRRRVVAFGERIA